MAEIPILVHFFPSKSATKFPLQHIWHHMILTKQFAEYFLCYFFPALLGAEARWKPDQYPVRVTLQQQKKYTYICLYPLLLHPVLSFADPASLSSSPRSPLRHPAQMGRAVPVPPLLPPRGESLGKGKSRHYQFLLHDTLGTGRLFWLFSFLSFFFIILLTSKQKRETYIGLFNFSC